MLVALTLGGFMRWDIRHPEKRFGDKLRPGRRPHRPGDLLDAGGVQHGAASQLRHAQAIRGTSCPDAEPHAAGLADLLGIPPHKGLAGHAEMEGKTLFLKFNTGPSGHGSPPAAGEAMALKRAGADGVKVFAVEGEGGLTAGASHETKNCAFGLGLDNLHYLIDWNDWGIDEVPASRDRASATPAAGSSRTASTSTAPRTAVTGPA